jgi:hypothetical protein
MSSFNGSALYSFQTHSVLSECGSHPAVDSKSQGELDIEHGGGLPSRDPAGQLGHNGGGGRGREVAMLEALGLEVCQDTSVGTPLIRGISNGQKQRLSLGMALQMPCN